MVQYQYSIFQYNTYNFHQGVCEISTLNYSIMSEVSQSYECKTVVIMYVWPME